MTIQLDKRFTKKLGGRFGKYSFQVGVLQDAQRRLVKNKVNAYQQGSFYETSTYAGGPVRKTKNKYDGTMLSDSSKGFRDHLGFNYLTEPFKHKSSDIIKFANEFFKLCFGRSEKRRCENLLQAIVRNPILRGDYGHNTPATAKTKGFDRHGFDTGQLFKSIKAFCRG